MNGDLRTKMEAVIAGLDPNVRALAKQTIETLLAAKVDSFEDLLALAQDRAASSKDRVSACWLLGQLRDKRASSALFKAFEDPNTDLNWEAAKSLGILQGKRAVRPLIDFLLEAEAPEKRAAAAYALGLIGDKKALDALLQALLNQNEAATVRGYAAEALAFLGDTRAVIPLIDSLRDRLPEVRFWSAYALGEIGDERASADLKRLIATDEGILPGWGKISEEAANAVESIQARSTEE
jgi:HEAT repeat protein